ncbi:hypothetical protein WN51_02573 [Melipona quadrifasciata]|uniref:Uncharacterized protein n=1 Tax=Melipona quadrifasciata TaxID=166423 RepID=A0A0M8ZTA6_9HYME|nr:hypothetical protein WN51_02573 [Melipona quadrifasciata]
MADSPVQCRRWPSPSFEKQHRDKHSQCRGELLGSVTMHRKGTCLQKLRVTGRTFGGPRRKLRRIAWDVERRQNCFHDSYVSSIATSVFDTSTLSHKLTTFFLGSLSYDHDPGEERKVLARSLNAKTKEKRLGENRRRKMRKGFKFLACSVNFFDSNQPERITGQIVAAVHQNITRAMSSAEMFDVMLAKITNLSSSIFIKQMVL